MDGIQKLPFTDQRQSFWSRLQRALSLSSSSGQDTPSPPRSVAGDTTEEESSFLENGSSGNHRNGMAADGGQESPPHTWSMGPGSEEELEQPEQADLSEDCIMIALECAAELDIRTKSMWKSLDNQYICITTIRSDLEDIRNRLAVVEAAIDKMAKEGKNNTTEDNATRRNLRSQQ